MKGTERGREGQRGEEKENKGGCGKRNNERKK